MTRIDDEHSAPMSRRQSTTAVPQSIRLAQPVPLTFFEPILVPLQAANLLVESYHGNLAPLSFRFLPRSTNRIKQACRPLQKRTLSNSNLRRIHRESTRQLPQRLLLAQRCDRNLRFETAAPNFTLTSIFTSKIEPRKVYLFPGPIFGVHRNDRAFAFMRNPTSSTGGLRVWRKTGVWQKTCEWRKTCEHVKG